MIRMLWKGIRVEVPFEKHWRTQYTNSFFDRLLPLPLSRRERLVTTSFSEPANYDTSPILWNAKVERAEFVRGNVKADFVETSYKHVIRRYVLLVAYPEDIFEDNKSHIVPPR